MASAATVTFTLIASGRPVLAEGPIYPDDHVLVDFQLYQALGIAGTKPSFGSLTDTSVNADGLRGQYDLDFGDPNPADGFGVGFSLQSEFSPGWYAGLGYRGFFTDGFDETGDPDTDNDDVLANRLDRQLADNNNAVLNGFFPAGLVDYASERIDLDRHAGDIVMGRQTRLADWLGLRFHSGVRAAVESLDRDVTYTNREVLGGAADIDTANIALSSDMIGFGPTFGVGTDMRLTPGGLTLSSSLSASLLASRFGLSRRDVYQNTSLGRTGIRNVDATTFGFVPMLDASVDLTQRIGRFHFGAGYTFSASLGGARSLAATLQDDVIANAQSYDILSEDIFTHAFYLRAGMKFGEPPASQTDNGSALFASGQSWDIDTQLYYALGLAGGKPSFGSLTDTSVNADGLRGQYDLELGNPNLADGLGVGVSMQSEFSPGWYAGLGYRGFFTRGSDQTGDLDTDTDNVLANRLDRQLADNDNAILNGLFQAGLVDYAAEEIDLDRHAGDIVMGRQTQLADWLGLRVHSGVRAAVESLDRDIIYTNRETSGGLPDIDTARIALVSDMIGLGPTFGVGTDMRLTPGGLTLSSSLSASLLASRFDLSRRDVYENATLGTTAIRDVDATTFGLVPMLDASVDLTQQVGRFHFGAGYTFSASLGGARSLAATLQDDVIANAQSYEIQSEDLFTHAFYLRAGMKFGEPPASQSDNGSALFTSGQPWDIDTQLYYALGLAGGKPSFGSLTDTAGGAISTGSYDLGLDNPAFMDGLGIGVSAQSEFSPGWYAGLGYRGFFTDGFDETGDPDTDTDNVLANRLDRQLADNNNAVLNGLFQAGLVDYASEEINLDRHAGDIVMGRRTQLGDWLGLRFHSGVRAAVESLDREITYTNREVLGGAADIDTANIALSSDMIGFGPTFGVGTDMRLTPSGLTLSSSLSASLLAAHFDLSRRDAYKNADLGTTAIRDIDATTFGFVPMLDASVDLTQRIGRFHFGAGYTFSASLGGARSLAATLQDDVIANAQSYEIQSEDIFTHAFYLRAGMRF